MYIFNNLMIVQVVVPEEGRKSKEECYESRECIVGEKTKGLVGAARIGDVFWFVYRAGSGNDDEGGG